jgi:carboxyl-terminal processing protease
MNTTNRIGSGILILAVSISAVAQQEAPYTLQVEPQDDRGSAQLTLDELRSFTDIFNQIRNNYVEEVDDKTLLESAINGMLSDLDPHSAYLPGEEFKDLEKVSRGHYVGLGVDVVTRDGRIVVNQVISPSPAALAGIDPGDIITSVDKKPVKGRPLQDAIDQLSGPPGSTIELVVKKPDEEPQTLILTRTTVKLPTLSFRLFEEHYGYFRLQFFHRESANDLKKSLQSVLDDGVQLHGLILDLRSNPGGVLQPAIEMADGFLDEGDIVSTRGRNSAMHMQFSASPGQWIGDIPLALLVDRGTASASEVLAGALQDNDRAIIVGERTFGKGSVQSVLPLRNGSGIKLTTARYYTPSGASIQASGIQPDVVVASAVKVLESSDTRKLEKDLEGHLDNDNENVPQDRGETVAIEDDFPLHEALNLLRATHILSRSGVSGSSVK